MEWGDAYATGVRFVIVDDKTPKNETGKSTTYSPKNQTGRLRPFKASRIGRAVKVRHRWTWWP